MCGFQIRFDRRKYTRLTQEAKGNWRVSLKHARVANINKRKERHSKYIREAIESYQLLKKDPLFLIGTIAYWGEGNKASKNTVSFSNTDPNFVKIVLIYYIKCLKIPVNKLRVGLFIYGDIDKDQTLKFWSSMLSIPKEQFIKIQVLKSRSTLTKRKSKYGICSLYFSSTEYSIKIREWIKLLGADYQRV